MDKVIAMSLFLGAEKARHDVYLGGAALNANMVWPGWTLLIYHDDTVPDSLLHYLRTFDCVRLIERPRHQDLDGMFWRFEAINAYEIVAVRDIDAVLLKEDWRLAESWINSGEKAMRMTFYERIDFPLNGGMFNWRGGGFPVWDYAAVNTKFMGDMEFLRDHAWPLIADDCVLYDKDVMERAPTHYKAIEPREYA